MTTARVAFMLSTVIIVFLCVMVMLYSRELNSLKSKILYKYAPATQTAIHIQNGKMYRVGAHVVPAHRVIRELFFQSEIGGFFPNGITITQVGVVGKRLKNGDLVDITPNQSKN